MTTNNQDNNLPRRRFLQAGLSAFAGAMTGSWLTGRAYATQTSAPIPPTPKGIQVPPVTVTTASNIRIHAVQTGFVSIKSAHAGPASLGLLSIALDRTWTAWLPIYTWIIEHPEGIIVVDTGESSQTSDPEFFNCDPATKFIYNSFLRFAVTLEDEIGPQLRQLGIDPQDVRWVVQTHLHSDHMDGLSYFPNSEILVSPVDYPNGQGAVTCRYPEWLSPMLVSFENRSVPGFNRSLPLTKDGDVMIVPTPGHALGHQSVLLNDGEKVYFFAGDTSFDEAQLKQGIVAGICEAPSQAADSLARIREHCQQQPTIYLPSHDPQSVERLQKQATVQI